MVKAVRLVVWLVALAAGLTARLEAQEPADYQLGDRVEADLISPVALRLVEPRMAESLAAEAVEQVPAIVYFHPGAAGEAEADLRKAFGAMRTNFLEAMASVYKVRKLQSGWLGSLRFQTLSATFIGQHRDFPRLAELLPLWATAQPDEEIFEALVQPVRDAMQQRIRPETLSDGFGFGPRVRLVTKGGSGTSPSADAESVGELVATSDLATLTLAQSEFGRGLKSEDAASAIFLAALLRPNCLPEVERTRQERERYVEARLPVERIEPGQLLARRDDVVDGKILFALGQLRTLNVMPVVFPGASPTAGQRPFPWQWLAVVSLTGLAIGWLARRRRASLLPARVGLMNNEARAPAAIRAGVMAQFSAWLKQRFVQQLLTDREAMVNAQRTAAVEMVELERRLDELHAPLRDRLRAYEKRVAELEQLLAAKNTENRELIKARIRLTRVQMEAARSRNPLELN